MTLSPEKKDASKEPKEDEADDIDKEPEPEPFRAPKGLLKMGTANAPGPVELKSSGTPTPQAPTPTPRPSARTNLPPAAPPGAQVRPDRPLPTTRPPMAGPPGTVDVRMQKKEGGPRPPMPSPQDLGPFDVQMQKGAPRLPKIEAPGEFDVVKPHAVPEPRPQMPLPSPLEGEVEVVDYRRTPEVDVTGEVLDPFSNRRRIGVVDTTFSRYNMGDAAEDQLKRLGGDVDVVRRTVPGVKDLAVECKILFEKHGCDIVLACGMVGRQPVDKTCAHEASMAIQWTQLQTNRHVLEVFVHEDEAKDEKQLAWLMDQRTREHAENAWALLLEPERLRKAAGTGQRQGFQDAGPIRPR